MEEKEIIISDNTKDNHWKSYFKSLLPLTGIDYANKKTIERVLKKIKLDSCNNYLFISSLPIYKYTFVVALKKYGELNGVIDYTLLSGYSLCEVMVKDAEVEGISSLSGVNRPDLLLLVIERIEDRVANKEYLHIVNQVLLERSLRGKPTWVFYIGSEDRFKREFGNFDYKKSFVIAGEIKQTKEKNIYDMV